ncbi:MAG: hypothetical protein AAF993_09440 [Pseudomonadota bacterium]
MSVNSFDPSAQTQPLDAAVVVELVKFAQQFAPAEGHNAAAPEAVAQADRYASLATHADWAAQASQLGDTEIEALIRIFTLGEELYSGWLAGDKSPVVPLVRELKSRGTYDATLTRWIKSHTNNKFLPHGSLMDRL